ncbi:L-threonylcarbamoyladenylate synthase [Candidatus Dependentiae bacterium]|nr:L-threonylcarbamoyladenylate synthase [Candidatus Dependentiae bacterium]MBU4387369.1 L-threonylcarbamoyladenylate synthase [Candidatus Dependentiae bacterium]
MNIFKNKIIYWSEDDSIRKLYDSICKDEISISSTDTILGFLGNTTQNSFDKIVKLKGRKEDKPFLILIDSYEKIFNFVDKETIDNPKILNIIKNFWPGPLTIIFNAKKNTPDFLCSKEKTIALRCPKHDGLQKILIFFDGLFSTSANKSNEQVAANLEDINIDIINNTKYIVIDKNNIDTNYKLDQTLPSTILDITNRNYIKVVREGAISVKELKKIYGEDFVK